MLFSIGDFSKICQVSIHTLRYWEKEGLLIPEKIDESSGYRFYSTKQLYSVQKIKAAKLNKFKNKEIIDMGENTAGVQMLLNKREELYKMKNEIEESLHRLDYAIDSLKQQKWPDYNFVVIKNIPEGIYLTHRKVYDNIYSLCDDFVFMYNCIWNGKPPITDPYECFAIYYHDDFPDKNIDAECCVVINKNFDISCCKKTNYQVKKIRGIEMAASCLHYGPHEMMGETFAYLIDWINANGFKICGYPRQNVISNENTPNISNYEFLTSIESQVCEISELIVPIQKKRIYEALD